MASQMQQIQRAAVVRAPACGAEGPRIEITFDQVNKKTLSVHPSANGYPTLFRAGEGLGGEGRGDGCTLHMLCPLKQVEP